MQIICLFGAHPVDTENWHCQQHFGANIDVWIDCFFSKITKKKSQSLVYTADCGAVPQFPFAGNPEPVYTCGHQHCHEIYRHKPLRSVACLLFHF